MESLEQQQQEQPYAVRMDPDYARQLATNGATLLLLDVPEGTLVGLDRRVFAVGPRFRGVKMVPPGVHLLSYQAVGRPPADGADTSAGGGAGGGVARAAPAVAAFLSLAPRQVVVRRWDAALEGLAPLADEDEEARYAEGVRRFDFDAGLAPYDLAGAAAWHALTCFVDAPLLARLLPPAGGGEVSAMAEALDPELAGAPRTAAERALEAHLRDGREALQRRRAKQQQQQQQQQQQEAGAAMETDGDAAATVAATGEPSKPSTSQPAAAAAPADDPLAGRPPRWGRARYTRLPRVVRAPPGATAAELTALNRDRTAALEQAAAATGDASGRALLGELQVAFAAFVLGQSLEGFLQWKALVALFLGCEAAPLGRRHADLFAAFLAAVRQQLAFGLGGGGGGGEAGGQQHNGSGGGDDAPCALGVPLVEELLPDSFLRRRFAAFFELLAEAGGAGVPPQVARQAAELEALLRARLKWDFRVRELRAEGGGGDGSGDGDDNAEDDDEDGPVVVELTDEQRRAAGLEPL